MVCWRKLELEIKQGVHFVPPKHDFHVHEICSWLLWAQRTPDEMSPAVFIHSWLRHLVPFCSNNIITYLCYSVNKISWHIKHKCSPRPSPKPQAFLWIYNRSIYFPSCPKLAWSNWGPSSSVFQPIPSVRGRPTEVEDCLFQWLIQQKPLSLLKYLRCLSFSQNCINKLILHANKKCSLESHMNRLQLALRFKYKFQASAVCHTETCLNIQSNGAMVFIFRPVTTKISAAY